MALQATQRWSDDDLRREPNGWTATLSWDVIGATTEADAMTAQVSAADIGRGAAQVPTINELHPRSTSMACCGTYAKRDGFGKWSIVAQYKTGTFDSNDNPLLQRPRIRWQIGSVSVPIDRDKNSAPLANSAGDLFDPPLQRSVPSIVIQFRRAEPFFDVSTAVQYVTCVNSIAFTIKGVGTIAAGQAMMLGINPEDAYTAANRFVFVVYEMECRIDGFKQRVVDQGYNGWWGTNGSGGKDRFYTTNTNGGKPGPVIQPVLLDGTGKPLDTAQGFLVGKKLSTAVANFGTKTGGTVDTTSSTKAVYLSFSVQPTIDFGQLNMHL